MKYKVEVPTIYRSSKWNQMTVEIIEDDGIHAITVNKKGKKLRFNKKWLKPITQKEETQ